MFVRLHHPYRTMTLLLVFALLFDILPHQVWAGLAPSTSISQTQVGLVTPHAENALETLVEATAAAARGSQLALPLPELGSLGARAQGQKILIDADAQQADAEARFKPESLSHPISVSRIQSAYRPADAVNGTVVITFTVTNHRPPSVTPPIDPNASITDTVRMVAEFDLSADPNTIRNVLLTDSLTSGIALVDADPLPNRRGADVAYNLGDIPPGGIVTATLTVQFPTGMADFAPLDTGATAWGTLRARSVSAATSPATLVSDATGGDWLRWTPDADTHDRYMLEKAAELGQDPIRIFEYVRGLGYESYRGSLRGTRGTLWSEAGNSLDQASLLIAMLRTSGVPARYMHGTLETARARELILSMFPEPTGVVGHVPADAEVSDPANDPDLLAETQDHWWVETYLPGSGWTALDPSFADAQPGDAFASASETLAEIHDSLRHKVTLSLKVELSSQLSAVVGDFEITVPISVTFNSVELVGNPVTLGYLVDSSGQGPVFTVIDHRYTPYFTVGGRNEMILGDTLQELLTNFPLGSRFITGEWLVIESYDPDGLVSTVEHEIVDSIGYESRQAEGAVATALARGMEPLHSSLDLYVLNFVSSDIPLEILANTPSEFTTLAKEIAKTFGSAESGTGFQQSIQSAQYVLATSGEAFFAMSGNFNDQYATASLIRSYYDTPAVAVAFQTVATVGTEASAAVTLTVGLDLLKSSTSRRAIVYPEQSLQARFSFNVLAGISDKTVEKTLWDALPAAIPDAKAQIVHQVSTADVLAAAHSQQIPFVTVVDRRELESLAISDEAKARISKALDRGANVLVPSQMVQVDEGKETIAWWELDPVTGHTVGVSENGSHDTVFSLASIMKFLSTPGGQFLAGVASPFILFFGYAFVEGMVYWAGTGTPHTSFGTREYLITLIGIIGALSLACSTAINTPTVVYYCAGFAVSGFILGGALLGVLLSTRSILDPRRLSCGLAECAPLPAHLIQLPSAAQARDISFSRPVQHSSQHSSASLAVHTTAEHAALSSHQQIEWASNTQHAFEATTLSGSSGSVYDQDEALLGTGAFDATVPAPGPGIQAQGAPLFVGAIGSGRHGYYASAGIGLGSASHWLTYTAQLTSTLPYTLTLEDASVSVNGSEYSGYFVVMASGSTTLAGSGHTAAPNFVDRVDVEMAGGGLMIGPATGAFTVGGQPVNVATGVAIGDYTGLVTISEESAATDRLELAGDADFFTLRMTPATSTSDSFSPVNFGSEIEANFSDTYTTTVEAPLGWSVAVDENGAVTATPPAGAAPGAYTLLVTAQSTRYPDLFAAAEHVVTVIPMQAMNLTVSPDPLLTVPMGTVRNPLSPSGNTNDGRVQVPGAAFRIDVANRSTAAHTFALAVSGLPADAMVLSADSLALPAGAEGTVGLYVVPPPGPLPAVGTTYNFTVDVSATDGSGLSRSAGGAFTMPTLAFNFVTAAPSLIYAVPGTTASFDVGIMNVGNAANDFPLSVVLPGDAWSLVNPAVTVAVQPGQTVTQTIDLKVPEVGIGHIFPIRIDSPAPGTAYTQTTAAKVQIVSAYAAPWLQTAPTVDRCVDSVRLAAALTSLGIGVDDLAASCAAGDCRSDLRDTVVTRAHAAAAYAGAFSPFVTADEMLRNLADDLATHNSDADITATLDAVGALAADFALQLCEVGEHSLTARFTPAALAVQPSEQISTVLVLANQGSVETTYAVTLTMPNEVQTFTTTIAPGASAEKTVALTAAALGSYLVQAQARAIGPDVHLPGLGAEATARLSVVDRFVQVLAVSASPAFVETGASATTVAIEVANVANVAQPATAHLAIMAPDGNTAWLGDYPITVLIGDPRTYSLASVNTSGWAAGVYTLTADLLDKRGQPIREGSSYGYLGVGQGLAISHGVQPAIVAPGGVTATTTISSVLLGESIFPVHTAARSGGPIQALPRLSQADLAAARFATSGDQPRLPLNSTPSASFVQVQPTVRLAGAGGFTRYEENHPDLRYNGQPLASTPGAWALTHNIVSVAASGGAYIGSGKPGDSASLTFSGVWVGLGFATDRTSGQVEIMIDGASQGTLDLYRRDEEMVSVYYDNLAPGVHTIAVTVLSTRHPNSSGSKVNLDFVDVWNGGVLPDGIFQHDDARVGLSESWSVITDSVASGGAYVANNHSQGVNAWFIFTGASASYQAIADREGGPVRINVDGVLQRTIDLYNPESVSRTVNLDGLGAGVHVLHVQKIWGTTTVDAFLTPAVGPADLPSTPTGIIRYEEDNPALRYNGYAFAQRPQSWQWREQTNVSTRAQVQSSKVGNAVSLTFNGRWANVGFFTDRTDGQAAIFIDGVRRELVDLVSTRPDVTSVQIGGLITGTHTISVSTVAGTIYLDYIEIWDGTQLADEVVNVRRTAPSERLHYSSSLVDDFDEHAIQGDFVRANLLNSDANLWYTFTGTGFVFYGFSLQNGGSVEVYVDGELVDTVSLAYPFTLQPLAYHYNGFAEGPHVVQIHNVGSLRVDAFASDPGAPTAYQPIVEWYDNTPAGASLWGGIHVPIVAGDVDGDGNVELVVATSDVQNSGTLFLYRGDGGDTGDGDPILWSIPLNIPNGFEDVGSPAIAELDGLPGAEIVLPSTLGLHVYHSDGSLYWYTDTLKSNLLFGTPAIGNLDLEPGPEIVVNLGKTLAVFKADGALAWQTAMPASVAMPLLADLTGDGLLDILVHDWQDTLTLYDYNLGTPQIVWSKTFTTPLHGYGSPAIADVDGRLPGGDSGPEIAIASEGLLTVLNADGSVVWTRPLDAGQSGGVSIADLDGDGEIELVTTMQYEGGRIYALNADGTLLWEKPAPDNSPLQVSLVDMENDGIYDVAWNGANQGFTLFSGRDGSVLFNEPLVVSKTGTDYPINADVDGDGYLEIVAAAQAGVRVFGFDGVWGPARPVWNQHSYHITNINDNLSVPASEGNSWEIHNTYHTQTPLLSPVPIHDVAVTHTVAISGVSLISGTLSHPANGSHPVYSWNYTQLASNPVVTRSLQLALADLRPGETRQVAEGTQAHYTLASGANDLVLPPLYVAARHVVAMTPVSQTTYAGGTVSYALLLSNPTVAAEPYTLTVAGLPSGWVARVPPVVALAAGTEMHIPLTVTVPAGTAPENYRLSVLVATGSNGQDQVEGELRVLPLAFDLSIDPVATTVAVDEAAVYTLTLTNQAPVSHIYTFTVEGVELGLAGLPVSVTVGAGETTLLPITATSSAQGPHPFIVQAFASETGATVYAEGVLTLVGQRSVQVALAPAQHAGGPGSTVLYGLHITNTGTLSDTYALDVILPAGWTHEVLANGVAVEQITISPHLFNTAALYLVIRPSTAALPGMYPVSVTVASSTLPAVTATALGNLEILERGVSIAILEGSGTGYATQGTYPVQVTNAGAVADTFTLSASGPLAGAASFTASNVSLAPGQSQQVDLKVGPVGSVLPGRYPLAVTAHATDNRIFDTKEISITLGGHAAVNVRWQPTGTVSTEQAETTLLLEVSNTGTTDTFFELAISAPGLAADMAVDTLYIPATMSAAVPVRVHATKAGTYTIVGTAHSTTSPVTASSPVTLTVQAGAVQHPPVAADDTATTPEDIAVTISALANDTDANGDTLVISSVTQPAHGVVVNNGTDVTYTPAANFHGLDTFTYRANDGQTSAGGDSNPATVQITVNPINDPPVARDDTATTPEDKVVLIDVLNNDTDVEGDALSVSITQAPMNGVAEVRQDKQVLYTPQRDFHGADVFSYTLSDGNGGAATATVTVIVMPVNDAPVAVDDNATTTTGTPITVNVLANDRDVDSAGLTVTTLSQPMNGAAVINPDSRVTYTPKANFGGLDRFSYTIDDGNGGTATATVSITVTRAAPDLNILYLSFSASGKVRGVAFADEDIVAYDLRSGAWSMVFDGSDVGITTNLDGFAFLDDGSLLLTFDENITLPGMGTIDDSDILRFTPTALGSTTAGRFECYFDGSDVSLTTEGEDIDAIDFAPALTGPPRLVISTKGDVKVPDLAASDEDLLVFNATSLGLDTRGTWELYFDGSDVKFIDEGEDIWSVWINATNGDIYFSTEAHSSTDRSKDEGVDVFVCTPSSLGDRTSCSSVRLFWDGAEHDLDDQRVDGLAVGK